MTLAEESSRFIKAGDINFHYHDIGDGAPLVLIHGGGPGASGWSNYQRNVDDLSKKFRLLIIDLPGYGKTDKSLPASDLFAYNAKVVRDFLDAIKVEKAHFIGNSLGGGTALKLAMDYPDRADKLVLMGPGGTLPVFTVFPTPGIKMIMQYYGGDGPTREKLRAFIDVMVYDSSEITDDLIETRFKASIEPDILAKPPLGSNKSGKPPLEQLWREDLTIVQHKTLLIWGRDDAVVPMDGAFTLLKQMPNIEFHVFSRCGHWAQWEHAPRFNRLVSDFLL